MKTIAKMITAICITFLTAYTALSGECPRATLRCIGFIDTGCCNLFCNCENGTDSCCLIWDPVLSYGCYTCVWTNRNGTDECDQDSRYYKNNKLLHGDCIDEPYTGECTCVDLNDKWVDCPKPCDISCP